MSLRAIAWQPHGSMALYSMRLLR
ncbi:MAG: hypothetical protein JWQ57_1766, partial [Mucilaginibacter sp.]|nr:hypothetical protein [Mucilaginibacter sp.]